MTVSADDLAHWHNWVGRTEVREERLDTEALRRYAAALGEGLNVEAVQPSLGHWAFFLPVTAADEIGPDGHPKRGGFLPPISLPRRMFAGSSIRFGAPLIVDEPARRTVKIVSLNHKIGSTGDLILLEQEICIEQMGDTRVTETQTIVYRDDGGVTPAVVAQPDASAAASGNVVWTPTPVELFRFSAVTFNSHRIHYDRPYAVDAEGYPDLVVHGPLTAARLYARAARDARPVTFSFRASAPLFVGQPIRLTGDILTDGAVAAIRCDGVTAMRATATF